MVPPAFVPRAVRARAAPRISRPIRPRRWRISRRRPMSISGAPVEGRRISASSISRSNAEGRAPRRYGARGRQRQHAVPARFDPRRDRRRRLRAAPCRPPDPCGRARRRRAPRPPRRRGAQDRSPRRGRGEARELHPHPPAAHRRSGGARTRLVEAMRASTRTWPSRCTIGPAMRGAVARASSRATACIRRRFRTTRSTEAVAFLDWIAQRQLHLPGHARISPAHRATPPPTRSRARASACCAIPSVRVLRRGRELVAMTPEIRAFLALPKALIITKAEREIPRPPARASRLRRREAVRRRRPPAGRIAHRRPVHRERLHQHHRRSALPAPQGREGRSRARVSTRRAMPAARCSTCSRTIRATSCFRSTRTRSTTSPSTS